MAVMSQGTSSINVPREGSQLPVVPMGMPLDETLAAEWNAGWHIPRPSATPATGRALWAEDGHSSSQVSVMCM